MRVVYVLEHASWDDEKNDVTNGGLQECLALKQRIPQFDLIICSRAYRSKRTAELVTGKKPHVDGRAGGLDVYGWWGDQEQKQPLLPGQYADHTGLPIHHLPAKKDGKQLMELIHDLLDQLPRNGKALIISHNRNMIAAEAIMNKEKFVTDDKVFGELQGFVIDDNNSLQNTEELF